MMTYVRRTTLQAVEGLNVAQLDYLVRPDGNTIGMLLAHMAAVEDEYFLETVEKVEVATVQLSNWERQGERRCTGSLSSTTLLSLNGCGRRRKRDFSS
jgi:hypothetical protein